MLHENIQCEMNLKLIAAIKLNTRLCWNKWVFGRCFWSSLRSSLVHLQAGHIFSHPLDVVPYLPCLPVLVTPVLALSTPPILALFVLLAMMGLALLGVQEGLIGRWVVCRVRKSLVERPLGVWHAMHSWVGLFVVSALTISRIRTLLLSYNKVNIITRNDTSCTACT